MCHFPVLTDKQIFTLRYPKENFLKQDINEVPQAKLCRVDEGLRLALSSCSTKWYKEEDFRKVFFFAEVGLHHFHFEEPTTTPIWSSTRKAELKCQTQLLTDKHLSH